MDLPAGGVDQAPGHARAGWLPREGTAAHPALLLVGERSVVRYVDAAVRPLPASIGDLPTDVGMREPWPHVH